MDADLRYPIGPPARHLKLTPEQRTPMIETVALMPARLRAAVAGLSSKQLDTPYRPGGWTVRQVVHHLADSHMNAFIRMKFTLTEDSFTVTPYDQARWAETVDAKASPIELSLALLEALHTRWD